MKRSRAVPLVLMGTVVACESAEDAAQRDAPPAPTFPTEQACLDTGVFAEAACAQLVVDDGATVAAEAKDYPNVAACQADDYFQDDYCVAKYEEAVQIHQDHGPAYSDLAACQADYGVDMCGRQTAQAGGGSFWSPFLTGYLVSSAIGNFNRPMPYYRDPYGGYRTASGYGFSGGNSYVSRDAYRQNQRLASGQTNAQKARSGTLAKQPVRAQSRRTTVARRGGFGGRSGGRGG